MEAAVIHLRRAGVLTAALMVGTAGCGSPSGPVTSSSADALSSADAVFPAEAVIPRVAVRLLGPATHDFGIVDRETFVSHTFRMRNEGAETVHFEPDVQKSCGCTEAKISRTELPPGEELEISTRIFVSGPHMRQRAASLSVATCEGVSSTFTLTFTPQWGWYVKPEELRVSGYAGEIATVRLVLHTDPEAVPDVPEVRCEAPEFDAILTDTSEGPDTNRYEVECSFRVPQAAELHDYSVEFLGGGWETSVSDLRVPLAVRTKPAFRAEPTVLRLPSPPPPGEDEQVTVLIRPLRGGAEVIEVVPTFVGMDGRLRNALEGQGGAAGPWTVKFSASDMRTNCPGSVAVLKMMIRTKKGETTLRVPVVAD